MKKYLTTCLETILNIQLPFKTNKNGYNYFSKKEQLIFENSNINFDFTLKNNLKYNPIFLNTFEILNQFVEDPLLTPIPKNFLIDCIKHLSIKKDSFYSVDYKSIAQELYDYNYIYSQDFMNNLIKFHQNNGYLTIITTQLNSDLSDLQEKLQMIFDPILSIELCQLLRNNYDTLTGVITSFDKDLTKNIVLQKQAVIILNRNVLKYAQDWKDTLEYQITHFIQCVVSLDKTLTNTYIYNPVPLTNYNELINKICEVSNMPNNKIQAGLLKYISYLQNKTQFHTTIKTLLNKIQRQYQTSKIQFLNNNKWKLHINKLENRNNWLNIFLTKLNNIDNEFGKLFDRYLLESKANLSYQDLLKYEQLYIILTYQILKINQINIDEIIKNHFKIFKLRDI